MKAFEEFLGNLVPYFEPIHSDLELSSFSFIHVNFFDFMVKGNNMSLERGTKGV